MNHDEGPISFMTERQSCGFCKHLRSKTDVYGTFRNKSRHWCMHPALINPELPIEMQASIKERGEYIGPNDDTPRWCPFITGKANTDAHPD